MRVLPHSYVYLSSVSQGRSEPKDRGVGRVRISRTQLFSCFGFQRLLFFTPSIRSTCIPLQLSPAHIIAMSGGRVSPGALVGEQKSMEVLSQAAGGTKGKAQTKARKKPRRAAAAAAAAAVASSYATGGDVDVYPTAKQKHDGGSMRLYCPFAGCRHSCLRYTDYKKHYRVHFNIRPAGTGAATFSKTVQPGASTSAPTIRLCRMPASFASCRVRQNHGSTPGRTT